MTRVQAIVSSGTKLFLKLKGLVQFYAPEFSWDVSAICIHIFEYESYIPKIIEKAVV